MIDRRPLAGIQTQPEAEHRGRHAGFGGLTPQAHRRLSVTGYSTAKEITTRQQIARPGLAMVAGLLQPAHGCAHITWQMLTKVQQASEPVLGKRAALFGGLAQQRAATHLVGRHAMAT